MIWDIANTVLEFLTIYLLFISFAHLKFFHRHLYVYIPTALVLSVFFCLDIPHYLILNVGLFILAQYISFISVPYKERFLYACFAVFITLTLELFFNTFLPVHLLHTFRGDTLSNVFMVIVASIFYYVSMKTAFHYDVAAFMRRHFILLLICFVIWLFLTQVYLQKAAAIWTYLPGLLSMVFFTIFIIGIISDIMFVRSEEHKQNIIYRETLHSVDKYLQELKIENHDYKHHIHHLQNMVHTASDVDSLIKNIDSYIEELDQSTAMYETILAIDNTLFKALLYGAYMKCSKENIPFYFTTTSLLPSFPIKDYQLVAAVENMISNAVEANELIKDGMDRFVRIEIYANSIRNEIVISNPLQHFTGNINDYFVFGKTSKDLSSHSGAGLTSILSAMSENGIDFFGKYDEEKETISFTISYRKAEVE